MVLEKLIFSLQVHEKRNVAGLAEHFSSLIMPELQSA